MTFTVHPIEQPTQRVKMTFTVHPHRATNTKGKNNIYPIGHSPLLTRHACLLPTWLPCCLLPSSLRRQNPSRSIGHLPRRSCCRPFPVAGAPVVSPAAGLTSTLPRSLHLRARHHPAPSSLQLPPTGCSHYGKTPPTPIGRSVTCLTAAAAHLLRRPLVVTPASGALNPAARSISAPHRAQSGIQGSASGFHSMPRPGRPLFHSFRFRVAYVRRTLLLGSWTDRGYSGVCAGAVGAHNLWVLGLRKCKAPLCDVMYEAPYSYSNGSTLFCTLAKIGGKLGEGCLLDFLGSIFSFRFVMWMCLKGLR